MSRRAFALGQAAGRVGAGEYPRLIRPGTAPDYDLSNDGAQVDKDARQGYSEGVQPCGNVRCEERTGMANDYATLTNAQALAANRAGQMTTEQRALVERRLRGTGCFAMLLLLAFGGAVLAPTLFGSGLFSSSGVAVGSLICGSPLLVIGFSPGDAGDLRAGGDSATAAADAAGSRGGDGGARRGLGRLYISRIRRTDGVGAAGSGRGSLAAWTEGEPATGPLSLLLLAGERDAPFGGGARCAGVAGGAGVRTADRAAARPVGRIAGVQACSSAARHGNGVRLGPDEAALPGGERCALGGVGGGASLYAG